KMILQDPVAEKMAKFKYTYLKYIYQNETKIYRQLEKTDTWFIPHFDTYITGEERENIQTFENFVSLLKNIKSKIPQARTSTPGIIEVLCAYFPEEITEMLQPRSSFDIITYLTKIYLVLESQERINNQNIETASKIATTLFAQIAQWYHPFLLE